MPNYDFTSHIDRHDRDALAIDGIGSGCWGAAPEAAKPGYSEIPMWVADMNFSTAPSITRAIAARLEHPLFGYFRPTDAYFDAIINWQRTRHGVEVPREAIGYQNGVHGLVCTTINLFTQPGDSVFVHTPVYAGFLGDLAELGRTAATSCLVRDNADVWRMDFDDMDRALKESGAKLAIFCSPHNPCGRVWERWEIERAMEVFAANDCIVLSDEIWADITFAGHAHIPAATVGDDARMRTITAYAPSKTFNLAGLIGSYHVIWNPTLRQKVVRYGEATHYNEMNVLSMHALVGAYSAEGHAWLDELLPVLEKNCRYVVDFINRELPGCHAAMPQGTYMVFMDCSENCRHTSRTLDDLLREGWNVGVAYQDGRRFGDPCSIRINCALPHDLVVEAMDRLKEHVFA